MVNLLTSWSGKGVSEIGISSLKYLTRQFIRALGYIVGALFVLGVGSLIAFVGSVVFISAYIEKVWIWAGGEPW